MGSPLSESPELVVPSRDTDWLEPHERFAVAPRRHQRVWKYVLLFLLTSITTTVVGGLQYAAFVSGMGPMRVVSPPAILLHGLWYSVPVLAILGAHEFGHYFACRYYRIEASLPYFLPLLIPWPVPQTGTLGAVIRIRQQFPSKRQLFDIGVAGPIAGFIVAIPVLLLGMSLSSVMPLPKDFQGWEFGEPLLFRGASWLMFGSVPDGYAVNLHPAGWAAWFGLLATAINLFPVGQLDGGHIAYAVLGRKSTVITVASMLCLVGLTAYSGAYLLWTVLTVIMLFVLGPHHPRTPDENVPLDRARIVIAVLAAIMFIVCFTPTPVTTVGLG
jgi:membrane-associated protease RseP (regulator of RpoE activity)